MQVAAICHGVVVQALSSAQDSSVIFTGGPKFAGKKGPPGPTFWEFWSPGPIFSPDQHFRDMSVLYLEV